MKYTSETPGREVRRQKKVDVVFAIKDPETGRTRTSLREQMKTCVPTRVCVACERSDLYCRC